jgi:thiamine-phosphate pyrophosphorylase
MLILLINYAYAVLYLVADASYFRKMAPFLHYVENAIQSGAGIIEFRYKKASNYDFFEIAQEVQKITRQYHVPLLINRPDMIDLISSAGIHIEQTTQPKPASFFTRLKQHNKLIGFSITDSAQIPQIPSYIDYLIIESILGNYPCIGLQKLRTISDKTTWPIIVFGGIEVEAVKTIMLCGGHGIGLAGHPIHTPPDLLRKFKQELSTF